VKEIDVHAASQSHTFYEYISKPLCGSEVTEKNYVVAFPKETSTIWQRFEKLQKG
jgi:hypothetical protein